MPGSARPWTRRSRKATQSSPTLTGSCCPALAVAESRLISSIRSASTRNGPHGHGHGMWVTSAPVTRSPGSAISAARAAWPKDRDASSSARASGSVGQRQSSRYSDGHDSGVEAAPAAAEDESGTDRRAPWLAAYKIDAILPRHVMHVRGGRDYIV